ncbi:MAG: threonylcarbamoyl-AMP synthase, partial [Candidatus Levybacteria bacterium RBG_13_35_9]
MTDDLKRAVKVLNKGGIIIFPTDTAFGIGCRIDNKEAIKRLFSIRKRPLDLPMPVLVSDIEMAKKYWSFLPENVEKKLVERYWPGALTIVLPANLKNVPYIVRGGQKNVGIRMPNNELILTIIEKTGVPVLGPSANLHGEQTPYSIKELNKNLVHRADLVLDGICTLKKASTVIDCSKKPWKI